MPTGGEQSCFDDNMAVEFFEGSLTDNEAAAVESHAAACEGCRMLLAALARSPSLEGDESGDSDEGMSPTLPAGGEAHVDLVQGTEVGRFVVLARIGRGGMGVVFAAYDPRLDRKVALKLLRNVAGDSDSAGEATTRLLREAQAIAQLSHPNVIQVYDVGTYKSEVYIAMEFVEGETLTNWLRRWVRPWEDILVKFREAGHALADAHASGMAHRDFKPDNVLVGTDERVRVMDFGLARSWFTDSITPDDPYGLLAELSDEAVSALNNTLTKTGTLLGTPRYMAPEQFLGGGTDARADQFSFCVALYEALYRQHPFERELALDMIETEQEVMPRPPTHRSRVPGWLHAVLVRGLSKDPKDRFPSMDNLLRKALPPRRRQSRAWVGVAAALGVALLGVTAYAMWYQRDNIAVVEADNDRLRGELEGVRSDYLRIMDDLTETRVRSEGLREELDRAQQDQSIRVKELQDALEMNDEIIADLEKALERRGITPPKPKPRPTPEAAKGLELAAIHEVVDPRMKDIEDCFSEWHDRRSADEVVEVTIRFDIDAKGAVRKTRMSGLDDFFLRECIDGNFKRLVFPTSDGITDVKYQFESRLDRQVGVSSQIVGARREAEPSGPPAPARSPIDFGKTDFGKTYSP